MARRPSTVSVVSLASAKAPLESSRLPGSLLLSPAASKLPRTVSQSGSFTSSKSQDDGVDIEPDELFAKHTIAELKTRQAQLRADAEAKQEDLRIMVGERYRDLLQASTSIISIATSVRRVQGALEETSAAIRSQRVPNIQNHALQSGKDDSHLHMLQVLSAHIKLLLDAPEHLWRLIEREKYFQAAWLFLLARVVHQALIRDDDKDDESWTQHGIDVLEQFPLIQRQWETVSHFRTQIIHRATLSLRSHDKSSEETCATLLTLHILDSRPLTEILTIYLSQRTRTLNALLAKGSDIPGPNNVLPINGSPPGAQRATERATRLATKTAAVAVRNLMRATLEVISRTLNTARAVFGSSSTTRTLATAVLETIRSSPPSSPPANLSAELLLTTQAVLNSLSSSTYVSLLPPNIRAYRPFVDLSSSSSSLSQETLRDKLGSWFGHSTTNLRGTFDKWLGSLEVVSAVWNVRSSLRKWMPLSGLEADEIADLTELLDEVFNTRITGIWKAVLLRAEKEFLQVIASLGSDDEDIFSPLRSLYHTPAVLQPPPGTGPSSPYPKFHVYKAALTQRLDGRAPRLQEALATLEDAANSLESDVSKMLVDGESGQKLVADVIGAYRPEAQALCVRVASALKACSEKLMANRGINMEINRLIFHAHIAKELSGSSFVHNVGCEEDVATGFREDMDAMFEEIMTYWEEYVVSDTVSYYTRNATTLRLETACKHPSPPMMECLYLLSSSIHSLGISHHQSFQMTVSQRIVAKFSAAFVHSIDDSDAVDMVQVLYDLAFLRHLTSRWKNADVAVLGHAIDRLQSHLTGFSQHDANRSASDCLLKTQMLISALLPPVPEAAEVTSVENGDKMAGVLICGVPVVNSQFIPAVELAPPSSRFPLLLIDAR